MTMLSTDYSRTITFDDLRGLRAEGYIRDSTLDQRDGFGPAIQRNNEERFAGNYGLILGSRWYTEFVSGRSVKKRLQFQQFLTDARADLFDVLLVDHTSRFGRNQAECICYKEELRKLGKVVVFVSQGIISGSDRDFLSERINETLDEQYSRNLSRYILAGMEEKAQHGLAVGPAPLGYKSELTREGRREKKVIDGVTMPVLLQLLRDYASGKYSFREVADRLNARGYKTQKGNLFTGYSVRDVLSNKFYDGKVIYHKDKSDEKVIDGVHLVPEEIKRLWNECQRIKCGRFTPRIGHPRGKERSFPFSKILKCHCCGQPYYGETINRGGWFDLRLGHERRTAGRNCPVRPRSRSLKAVKQEFNDRVLPYLSLPAMWKDNIIKVLRSNVPEKDENVVQRARLEKALGNLRKQHKWGDINDEEYNREKQDLVRQLKALCPVEIPINVPNLERASAILNDMRILWCHPGVVDRQREELISTVFSNMTMQGDQIVSIEPKPEYAPLFASIVIDHCKPVGYSEVDSPPSPPEKHEAFGETPRRPFSLVMERRCRTGTE